MSELDVLRRLGDQIVPPPFEALRETARRRARRTRVASIAVAASVVAASVTTVYLGRDADRQSEPAPVTPPTSRPLTYADGSTIHYGDDTIEAEGPVVELDLTDYGVGFRTDDGRIWFTDGSTPDQLGSSATTGPGYGDNTWPLTSHPGWMLSSNAGSRLVWFEFPSPGEPEVVVYDTATRAGGRTGHRRTSEPGHTAVPAELSERFVYWFKDPDPDKMPEEQTQVRYDPATGEQSPITEPELLSDLDGDAAVRSVRLKGDGRWETAPQGFHYSDGMGQQMGLDLCRRRRGRQRCRTGGPGRHGRRGRERAALRLRAARRLHRQERRRLARPVARRQTVVVVSPLRQGTDLIACHLETRRVRSRRPRRPGSSSRSSGRPSSSADPRRIGAGTSDTSRGSSTRRPVRTRHTGETTHDPHLEQEPGRAGSRSPAGRLHAAPSHVTTSPSRRVRGAEPPTTVADHDERGHHEVTLAFAGDVHFQIQVAALLDDPRGLGPITRALVRRRRHDGQPGECDHGARQLGPEEPREARGPLLVPRPAQGARRPGRRRRRRRHDGQQPRRRPRHGRVAATRCGQPSTHRSR